jgi:hypothetical protein
MDEEIEAAMQHAPHPGLHSIKKDRATLEDERDPENPKED